MKEVHTTCPYCGVGCGVLARRDRDGGVQVRGDPDHPANFGRLCSKGAALGDTVDLDGRLLYPEINGQRRGWDEALNQVADGFQATIQQHGPASVAFYVSGQLLTEAYYVANKLMKGFIQSGNIDTNSRLCMSSAVAAHMRAFGEDIVPCTYEDLEAAEVVVLVGSNTAWCHPVLFQRITDSDQRTVVTIDPRRTPTAERSDLHLPIRPGTDAVLFNGLLAHLEQVGAVDSTFADDALEGAAEALAAARQSAPDTAAVAAQCGVTQEAVERFFERFAGNERVVTVFSQGVNQSSSGTDKANAIINCHLLSGRIGRGGMGPFSFTGQPNAMGGREVGGLANQLAAHLDPASSEDRARLQTFWNAPGLPEGAGLKAVDLFEAIDAGQIRAVWIMGTNPVDSLPDADRVRRALGRCELVVVSDCMRETDTTALADVLLPALTWGERDGTVTNSERCISRQRPFLDAPGEARADWWIICQVARRMGFGPQFDYLGPGEIFAEHARLSGLDNAGARAFDISGLADASYETLGPVRWPVPRTGGAEGAPLFGDKGLFAQPRPMRLVPITPRPPACGADDEFPLVLNTGRVRDHWHTMTRTGKSPRLSAHTAEPFGELHPADARGLGVADGALIRVRSRRGEVRVRARVSEVQQPGTVFVPIHWNDQFASAARVGALLDPVVDPVSGQPESKSTPVRVEPWRPAWFGFLLSRRRLEMGDTAYWSCARGEGIWCYDIAGDEYPDDWARAARALLCRLDRHVNWIEFMDSGAGRYRAARLTGDRLESCIFIGTAYPVPGRGEVAELFQREMLSNTERGWLLSGRSGAGIAAEPGPLVCTCRNVGRHRIVEAIREQRLSSVREIGEGCGAGTQCGSCVPELERLLRAEGRRKTA